MSSHHIVREKQEPALIILDCKDFDSELLGQLLEWSPTIICTEKNYDYLKYIGIKVDYLLLEKDLGIHFEENINFIYTYSYVEDGLNFLIKNHYPSVNLIGDKENIHLLSNFCSDIDIVLFTPNQKIFPINIHFSKWIKDGVKVEVYNEITGFEGLKQIGDHVYEKDGDGFYTFLFDSPMIFIAEFL